MFKALSQMPGTRVSAQLLLLLIVAGVLLAVELIRLFLRDTKSYSETPTKLYLQQQ